MSIFRTNDPTQFDDVDGIIINESAPAPNVAGVAANIGILVAQAERGLLVPQEVGSVSELFELYGKNDSFGLNKTLKNKGFGRLKVIRAVAAAAVTASVTINDGEMTPTDVIKFTAKQGPGLYGNDIVVAVEEGSDSGQKFTIYEDSTSTVLATEVYDNVDISTLSVENVFAGSLLVSVLVLDPTKLAEEGVANLAGGTNGAIADTDYQTAIAKAAVEGLGNVLFLDSYNATKNGYLKSHAAETQDKMVILAGLESDGVAAAITDVAAYRDVDGRVIYAYPWIETNIGGVKTFTNPASWVASIITQTAPNIDPAFTENSRFLSGVLSLKQSISRAQYIQLKDAGICAFELDSDIGFKIKSGITTQIANSSKVTILRRRMADFLTNSAGKFLKNYQNAVNSKANRALVKGALVGFVTSLENDGILPKDSEVTDGKAKLIDTESANTNLSIGLGFFKIIWRQRIFSSMRYIVLNAEIGETVVVTESN